jgi:hypothetical protein
MDREQGGMLRGAQALAQELQSWTKIVSPKEFLNLFVATSPSHTSYFVGFLARLCMS